MANETPITIIGNLVSDPELRFIPSGAAVCNFSVAVTPRKFDRQSNEWVDGKTVFWDCTAWREQAENVAESFQKGMRVIVTGNIDQDEWEDKATGAPRTKVVLQVDEAGPSMKYATAQVRKVQKGQNDSGGGFGGGGQPRGGGQQRGGQRQQARPQGGQQRRGPAQYGQESDPWSQQGGGNYDWGSGQDEEPPF